MVDIKADLHRLQVIIQKSETSFDGFSSLSRLQVRYSDVLKKYVNKHRRNVSLSILKSSEVDAISLEIIRTCERSISKLRQVMTYLRSTMLQEHLSSLALININNDLSLDLDSEILDIFEEILDIFARDYPHRLELVDVLSE